MAALRRRKKKKQEEDLVVEDYDDDEPIVSDRARNSQPAPSFRETSFPN